MTATPGPSTLCAAFQALAGRLPDAVALRTSGPPKGVELRRSPVLRAPYAEK